MGGRLLIIVVSNTLSVSGLAIRKYGACVDVVAGSPSETDNVVSGRVSGGENISCAPGRYVESVNRRNGIEVVRYWWYSDCELITEVSGRKLWVEC